ncbi:DUF2336 domain-containing protein [Cohaesibacter gelatinilyticus]|uniref:DUF2336 domain-containing protein n=1 Tax=Cohaesibacter gelatinilyticus TaxID=372072 RepID=A0A285PFM1_9HYPH|nr:DUF2336 domain-containing protein [Cohaesibacter gelatinilyticus]SNZ20525.1 hypothetical protein SAMN06265368_3629 [Cohaesibacter gelatinilyticus]
MLDTIADLAREKSSDKRRELLGKVADLFFDGAEHHTQQEALIFRDIVLKMLNDIDLEGRTDFSQRAAPRSDLPPEVARQLAQDEVAVAGPMLQHSPVLTDDDFVEFSQKLSPEHLVSIAQRDHLSGTVTDALIENGTREVWHKVSQNHGAEITENGFNKLVDNAADDAVLQASLCGRPDIPASVAENLLPLLPEEGKRRLAWLFENSAEEAEALVGQAQKAMVKEKLAGKKGRIEAKILINDVKAGKTPFSDALDHLIEGDRTQDIIMSLSAISEIEEAAVSNAFYQIKDEAIAILCKSTDVTEATYTRLISMRCTKLHLPDSMVARSVERYKVLDLGSSQRAMRFVQMRKSLAKALG